MCIYSSQKLQIRLNACKDYTECKTLKPMHDNENHGLSNKIKQNTLSSFTTFTTPASVEYIYPFLSYVPQPEICCLSARYNLWPTNYKTHYTHKLACKTSVRYVFVQHNLITIRNSLINTTISYKKIVNSRVTNVLNRIWPGIHTKSVFSILILVIYNTSNYNLKKLFYPT